MPIPFKHTEVAIYKQKCSLSPIEKPQNKIKKSLRYMSVSITESEKILLMEMISSIAVICINAVFFSLN